ncbi:thioredoxin family protein [Levilinea saccharolytica]|nr:thioredoxin domain-containing protein [Levilinea saccharolytica]
MLAPSMRTAMQPDEFTQHIQSTQTPTLVEFWAPWCAPCRAMTPDLERAAEEHRDGVTLLRINADSSHELLRQLGVMGIPTLIGYQQGQEVFRRTGAQNIDGIREMFTALSANRPLRRGPSPADRVLRLGAGLALVILGLSQGGLLLPMAAGLLLAFTGIYDRCPIYQTLAPRLKSLLRKWFLP